MYTINYSTPIEDVTIFVTVEELSKDIVKIQVGIKRPNKTSVNNFLPMRRKSLNHLTSYLNENVSTIINDYKLRDVYGRAIRFHTPIECRTGIDAMSMNEIYRNFIG